MYKLLCMDMDGTLLNSKGEITERSLKALKKASEKGVKITICTGRIFTFVTNYADLLGIRVPIIAANGAYIREKDKSEVIYKAILGLDNCRKILNIIKKYKLYPHFNTAEIVLTEKIIYSSEGYVKLNKMLPPQRQIAVEVVKNWDDAIIKYQDEILKCICVDEDRIKIEEAKKELLKIDELEVVSSAYNNFEVMSKGVSKGRAVEVLAGFYNIRREEVICIGDNENDLSMITYAGMGVAMGNAENSVKEAAGFITDTNDNDGVALAIEKLLLT